MLNLHCTLSMIQRDVKQRNAVVHPATPQGLKDHEKQLKSMITEGCKVVTLQ